jgi:serine/threonine protein kinase
MTIKKGAALAQYKVTAALGEGGMGEVWRAEDEKLGREVALKVLPEEFAKDPERMARFEREAKVLASLNHPNIATLYGLESVDSESGSDSSPGPRASSPESRASSPEPRASSPVTFLAMELVEGEDLSERIKRGAVPIDEAVSIALQIAEALEAAHDQGIVHRDLKPANIKLRPDGTVKVLDFGLAKAWETDHGDSSLSMSPTVTSHATAAGLILGTAAYMSPEQAAGTPADRRADIWSFGVVLWEMLTGRKLFEGATVSHVLASVLKDTIDLDELPTETPTRIRSLVSRCLRKEPRQRLQAIGEARIALEMYGEDPEEDRELVTPGLSEPSRVPAWRNALPWVAAALGVVAVLLWFKLSQPPERVLRTSIPPPADTSFHLTGVNPGPAALSPDGTQVAFSARDAEGVFRLYLRALDQPEAHVLSGTEGAQYPFWSPDSEWIAFFTMVDGTLKKVDASGGPPITICDAANGKGGSWGSDGLIVFTPNSDTPIHRVSASGGESEVVTQLDKDRHNSHRHPRFLPDGRRFLYLARGMKSVDSAIMVGSLDGEIDQEVFRGTTQAEFAADRLFFVREGTLMAQDFNSQTLQLEGEAVPLAEETLTIPAAALAVYTVSRSGVLAYHIGRPDLSVTPKWYDRSGRELGALGDAGEYLSVALSPDGASAAFTVTMGSIGTLDIWIYDLARDVKTRFTFDDGMDWWPVWSPDGSSLAFASDRDGSFQIYRMGIGGMREAELLIESDRDLTPRDWSRDGLWLVYTKNAEETGSDIWAAPIDDSEDSRALRLREGTDFPDSISPDGRWLAYSSDESGTPEVYITPFPDAERRWQVSTSSGFYSYWNPHGRELVYQQLDGRVMSVEVELGEDSVRLGHSVPLFDLAPPEPIGPSFAPSADFESFLVIPRSEASDTTLLSLMVGWPEALEEK